MTEASQAGGSKAVCLPCAYSVPALSLELKMIEARLISPQSTIFGTVKKLEERGLVRLSVSKDDRRVRIAELTDEGLELCRSAVNDRMEAEDMLTSGLSKEEAEILCILLAKVDRTLSESLNQR